MCQKSIIYISLLHGEIPNEKDLPSHQMAGDAEAVEADAKHKPLLVRGIVHTILIVKSASKVHLCITQASGGGEGYFAKFA